MRWVVMYGGSGSTYLTRRFMNARKPFSRRPDIVFTTVEAHRNLPKFQFLDNPDYSEATPLENVVSEFAERSSGFQLRLDRTIEENLLEYGLWLQERNQVALWGHAFMAKFFSRNGFNPVYLIRHPLSNYTSLCCPGGRHPEMAASYGGWESEGSIRWFANLWNSLAEEALTSGAQVVRYESARKDASGTWLDSWMKGWNPNQSLKVKLPEAQVDLLRNLTAGSFNQLYSDWNIF